jgi:3-hydroxyisobutyrate dehydrogenase
MILTSEAPRLGVNNGRDPAALFEIIDKGSGNNWSREKYNPWPGVPEDSAASRDYQRGFMVELMQKGLTMAAAHASRSQTPIGAVTNVLYGIHGNAAGNLDLVPSVSSGCSASGSRVVRAAVTRRCPS